MAGTQWDGKLNFGGVIGGLAGGAIAGAYVFTTVDANNLPRWAGRAPVLAVIGGAYVGTMVWGRLFGKDEVPAAAVQAVYEQLVQQGAKCPQCDSPSVEYRLTGPGQSLDEPCITCQECGCFLTPSEFVDVAADRMAA